MVFEDNRLTNISVDKQQPYSKFEKIVLGNSTGCNVRARYS